MLTLALRNIALTLGSRLPQVVMVALSMALLFLGNCLLDSSRQGLRSTYVNAFTGDWSVSARATDDFTLFGSDLIGRVTFRSLPDYTSTRGYVDGSLNFLYTM